MEYIDLRAQYRAYQKEIDEKISEILQRAHFIIGNEVDLFEKRIAQYVGKKYAVSCSDGTSALQLIFMAYGIKEGDAVFCPDMTFIASIEPACLLGATPIFCDIDEKSYNLSPDSLERQIKSVIKEGRLKPRAVVAVDFLGNPADYEKLESVAERYGLLLIEDAAQGMGASYKGKRCGSFGDIAATSFFPTKPLGCYGDGGAVFTDDEEIYKVLLSLRVHGKGKTKYDNVRIGINSRLDELQAGILNVKLGHLEDEIQMRQKFAEKYSRALDSYAVIPKIDQGNVSAYAQYILVLKSEEERDGLKRYLEGKEIPTIQYYPNPLHKLPVFSGTNSYGERFEHTKRYAKRSLGIPFGSHICESDQLKVMEAILEWENDG